MSDPRWLAIVALSFAASGCGGEDGAGAGGRCASSADCAEGLICDPDSRTCGARDASTPPIDDGGPPVDGAPMDAVGPTTDSGPGPDASPPMDSGSDLDAGPTSDAGPVSDTGPGIDLGPPGADTGPLPDAAPPAPDCGDRTITVPEECDDGNRVSGDGCSASCIREISSSCGDGNVDYAAGEECDDRNRLDGDGCDMACRVEVEASCGDGALDIGSGEQCDDGARLPGDGCSDTCQIEPVGMFCGDGVLDTAAGEVCDDSNVLNGDACNPTCNLANATEHWVGMVGAPGFLDATGAAAQIGGAGVLTADDRWIWLADGMNRRLRRIDPITAEITTIAGDGTNRHRDGDGTAASFAGLESITTDGTTLWIGSGGYLRTVSASPPYTVATVAGNGTFGHVDGTGSAARFRDLRGVTYYRGLVYLLDSAVERMTPPYLAGTLRVFDPATNEVRTLAGDPTPPAPAVPVDGAGWAVPGDPAMGLGVARFVSPRYMTSDNSGNLFIADTNGNTLRVYNTVTHVLSTFGGVFGMAGVVDGTVGTSQINRPRGITSDGTSIYFVEADRHVIRQGIIATTEITTMIGMAGMNAYVEGTGSAARVSGPFSITYHFPTRSLFFLDGANAVVRRIR